MLTGKYIACLYHQQFLQLILGDNLFTTQRNLVNSKLLTLSNIDGDINGLLVRCNRYLGRINTKIDITIIQVIGTQGLEIRSQQLA